MNYEKELNSIIKDLNNKNFIKVIHDCKKLINLKFKNAVIYNLYGLALQKIYKYDDSIEMFNKSIELQENNYLAINNLAVSLKARSKFKIAEEMYVKCLKIKSNYVIAILNYAKLKQDLNQIDEAIKLSFQALNYNREVNATYIFFNLTELYKSKGDFENAKKYAKKIIEINPFNIHGHILLSEFINHEIEVSHLDKMEKIFNQKNLKDNETIELAFAIGKVYDKLMNYDRAFHYFKIGNEFKKKQTKYNYLDHSRLHNSIIAVFKKTDFKKIKKEIIKKKIIFICGMPRSGTTLVEQIVSSHNQVVATGENNFLSSYIKKNYIENFNLFENKIFNDFYSKDNLIQDNFFNLLDDQMYNSQVFTDKTVQNFLWVGFINIFFTNSKIIITDRDPKDICLSIFKINFKNGFMNFAYDQKDIANFYSLYSDMINFWKKCFPEKFYTIKYEKLVDNPEIEIKKLIKYCDLEWDPNCLEHYKNKSPIKTASINQARKPIYKSSKNLSDNYSNYLNEMFSLLEN